MGCR